jgi:hypothetical protein
LEELTYQTAFSQDPWPFKLLLASLAYALGLLSVLRALRLATQSTVTQTNLTIRFTSEVLIFRSFDLGLYDLIRPSEKRLLILPVVTPVYSKDLCLEFKAS